MPVRRPLLWSILALAVLVRVWGVGFGLPFAFHPDEGQYVQEALHMGKAATLRPWTLCNPSLYTYVLIGVVGGPIGTLSLAGWPKEDLVPLAYLIARLVNVAFGVGAVYLLYLIGGRYVGPFGGYAAATFLALNFLHGRDSHFATNDIPAVTLGLAAFYLILRVSEGSFDVAALAGFALGLAVAMKYNLAVLALPLCLALAVRLRTPPSQERGGLIKAVAASIGAAVAGFLMGTPYALADSTRFLRDIQAKAALGTVPEFGQTPELAAVFYLSVLGQGVGLFVLGLASIGAFLVWRQNHRWLGTLVFVVVMPYLYLMFHYKIAFARFALPLLPFVCLLAAVSVHELHRLVGARPFMRYAAACVLLLSVLEPASRLVWHDILLSREDTRIQAKRWIEARLSQGTRIGTEDYGPPLSSRYAVMHEWALPVRSPESWRAAGTQYIVTSSFMADRTGPNPDKPLGVVQSQGCGSYPPDGFSPALYTGLLAEAREVAKFSPWRQGLSLPFALDDVYSPFWRVWDWRYPGPMLTIYELS